MPKTITFTVPVPAVGESSPVSVVLYSSATLTGTKTEEAVATLASLGYTDAPPETLDWLVASIDGTEYYWLHLVTSGVESAPVILTPETAAGTVDVVVWTEDAIGVAAAGVKFRALPTRRGGGTADPKTIITKGETLTDANGYAILSLYADSGSYSIQLVGYSEVSFDTTGQSGLTINYVDEL